MTITFEIRNGTCLLALSGDFDRTNAGELADIIEECLRSASSLALDFQAVTFVDGGILTLVIDVLGGMNDRGWLAIVRPAPRVRRLLDITGLPAIRNFRLFSTMEEALEAIDRG